MAKFPLPHRLALRGASHAMNVLLTTGHIVHCVHGSIEVISASEWSNPVQMAWLALNAVLFLSSTMEMAHLTRGQTHH